MAATAKFFSYMVFGGSSIIRVAQYYAQYSNMLARVLDNIASILAHLNREREPGYRQ